MTAIQHPNKVKFFNYVATVNITIDANSSSIAKVQLWCKDGPLATAKYPVQLPYSEVAINYEDEDLLDALLEAEIVQPPHRSLVIGTRYSPVCRVNIESIPQ